MKFSEFVIVLLKLHWRVCGKSKPSVTHNASVVKTTVGKETNKRGNAMVPCPSYIPTSEQSPVFFNPVLLTTQQGLAS